ncbi:uncharacterized protein LOC123656267 isoform X1 [Melitaea cinxia]|uniref:uncharacterized protein LOC123656267 isoform X1 n=3 Tax=Melitaea cinxia TaxID=113334 RepID=UPI001E27297D|nr:uncharacterized protein LOC123656267 isoform X1 [Melitaea cinxia]
MHGAQEVAGGLPHHAVHNEHSKTTKLRVVFNGSLKSQCKISLNNVMLNGPIVQSELFDILVLFRTYRYTLMCDIEKMFRQIFINSIHTPLQNILWRDNPQKPIICLQLQTVTYGLKSSTYLATRCLLELAYIYKDRFPLAADAIIRNTYVDDIICGADNIDQLRNLKQELIQLLSLGSFTLHKWCSNNTQILEDIPSNRRYFEHININKDNMIKTLGLKYNILTDSFVFSCPAQDLKLLKTKREILSFIGKIYDPLGLIGPIIVTAKLFMQSLWSLKINWDEAIPSSLLDKWYKFGESLEKMNPINTQRGIVFGDTNNVELLGYCDASFDAIACCLYLRVFHRDGRVSVALLCSKSRVAPLKKTLTIPNLELNSALLLSQLTHKVNNTLKARFPLRTILHSDSQIVLAWLGNKNIKKNTYVSRRVREITDLTKDFTWTYVKGKDNPADLLSRGTAPHKLEESYMWFHGPQYLSDKYYEHIMYDYKSCVVTDSMPCDTLINSDKSVKKFCNVGQFDLSEDIFYRYSNFYKLRRIIALILRFKNNTQNPKNKLCGAITPKELCTSQVMIFRHIQEIHFHNEIKSLTLNKPVKSNLSSLHIFLDHQQLIRVGGRLDNAPNISYDKKHPIVLPKSDHVTHTLINSEHLRLLHAGAKLVLSSLSQAYWIVGGIREVKKVLHRCIGCFQIKAATAKQLMGSLPAERTTPARPFEVTGVDFCGPFEMKIARIRKPLITKAYIALFVCFSTKAIHLELISDLTTETFLACLRRFISRRGVPNRIYCDNAKTFKGASNYLTELYNLLASKHNMDSVHHFCSDKLINFKFIPSYAPEFGGLWEAGVKSVKYHLKRVVGFACLTFEELYTIITQIEAILNSRPLLPMSSDISDLTYLTPGHFLIGAPLTSIPEPNLSDININRLKFWQICTKIKQEFWKLWSNDYLTQLQNRPKWKYNYDNLKEGDLVIVKQVNVPSLYWPMGRIVKTFPGSDHKVRVAEVKMANGRTYVRSYQKLCPLPLVN